MSDKAGGEKGFGRVAFVLALPTFLILFLLCWLTEGTLDHRVRLRLTTISFTWETGEKDGVRTMKVRPYGDHPSRGITVNTGKEKLVVVWWSTFHREGKELLGKQNEAELFPGESRTVEFIPGCSYYFAVFTAEEWERRGKLK